MKNSILGYFNALKRSIVSEPRIIGARLVSIDGPSEHRLRMFSYPDTYIRATYLNETGMSVYIWGTVAHSSVKQHSIPDWIGQMALKRQFKRFRELLGCFVIIIEESRQERLLFVTDILGVRPLFVQLHDHQIIFGSHAWPMFEQGLTSREVDYEAVACWLAYRYNCNGGAIFKGIKRLAAGRVYQFDQNGLVETPYGELEKGEKLINTSQAADEMHEIVTSTVRTLLSETQEASFALSGGWDSRYLLALAVKETNCNLRVVHVANSPMEKEAALKTAKCLGVDLKIIEVPGNEIDAYSEYYRKTVDGFPISLNPCYLVAQSFPGLPSVNGFLGDSLMRGANDRINNRLETEYEGDIVDILQKRTLWAKGRGILFVKPSYWRSILAVSRTPIQNIDNEGIRFNKRFLWSSLYVRLVHYIANNFLQPLEISEPILPLMNFKLLNYKLRHNYKTFSDEIYKVLFQRYFPRLAEIPTAAELARTRRHFPPIAKYTKSAARCILPHLLSRRRLEPLSKLNSTMICSAAFIGAFRRKPGIENAVLEMYRVFLLEEQMRKANVAFDWNGVKDIIAETAK